LNDEAGKLLLEDYPAYCSHARLFTEVHALRPKPLVIPAKSTLKKSEPTSREEMKSTSNSKPLTSSQAQNTLLSDKPKILLFGIGVKRLENEDGENRPAKRSQGIRLAGKGDLRRL
jgi:ubiquitin-conjugating enzyme E2 S